MDEKQLMEQFDKLNRRMRRYFDSFFAGMPLTSVQALTLQYVLVESEKRDVFQKDLEEFLEIKGSSVTSLLNNLERNGYLRREPLAEDARYKRLVPTKEAYSLRGEVDRRVMAYMHGVFAGLGEEELACFPQSVVERMSQNASK